MTADQRKEKKEKSPKTSCLGEESHSWTKKKPSMLRKETKIEIELTNGQVSHISAYTRSRGSGRYLIFLHLSCVRDCAGFSYFCAWPASGSWRVSHVLACVLRRVVDRYPMSLHLACKRELAGVLCFCTCPATRSWQISHISASVLHRGVGGCLVLPIVVMLLVLLWSDAA